MLQAYEYWEEDEPAPSHAYKEAVFLLAPDPLPASVNYQSVRSPAYPLMGSAIDRHLSHGLLHDGRLLPLPPHAH